MDRLPRGAHGFLCPVAPAYGSGFYERWRVRPSKYMF